MTRAMMATLCLSLVACATVARRAPCGEFSPVPPPRIVPGPAAAGSAPDSASAVLVVSELCSGRRIPGAYVQFVDATAGPLSTATDSAGRAVLHGSAGTQRLRLTAIGFHSDTITVPLRATHRDSVFVSLRLARSLLDRVGPGAPPADEDCCR